MMIVDQNVLQMTNQIVDMVNKTCKDFRQIKLKSFSYLLEIYFRDLGTSMMRVSNMDGSELDPTVTINYEVLKLKKRQD